MTLTLNKITGFLCADSEVKIFDTEGRPFYIYPKPDSKPYCHFNLPAGEYITKNNLTVTGVRKYKVPSWPKAEWNLTPPKTLIYVKTGNPNKASIILEKGLVILGTYFDVDGVRYNTDELPKPFIKQVLCHEVAHYLYGQNGEDSERKCDKAAQIWMLTNGYNPSQVGNAFKYCLNAGERADIAHKFAKDVESNTVYFESFDSFFPLFK